MKKSILMIVTLIVLMSRELLASGFQINESGARALGLGNAFTGLADDPSAVYFNPAGITQLLGTHFSIGATYIAPSSTFTGPVPSTVESKLKDQFFTPINAYFTQSVGSNLWVGFGVNNPFGLGTQWEDDWIGRYRTTETEIRTFNFSPVVAYKFSEQFSIAAGFSVSYADVLIARKIKYVPTGNPAMPLLVLPSDANLEMEGDNTSFGYSAAIMYKPVEKLSLGVSFHSEISYDFDGDAVLTAGPGTPAPMLAALPSGKITAPLSTPMVLSIGAAYKANEKLLFSADFQYNGWSSYDKLEVTFNDYKLPTGAAYVSTSERDYENSFIGRVGSEYVINNKIAVRAGVFYDKSPVKDERLDPVLPDADRIGLNIGLGYQIMNNLTVDVAYLNLIFMEREISSSQEFIPVSQTNLAQPWNGTYNSSANLIALNLSYGF